MALPESELRRKLDPKATDLYDHVAVKYPMWSDEKSLFGTTRPGTTRDYAFRNLLRAALDGTPAPTNWQETTWSDSEVAVIAQDEVVIRRAWALLASDSPDGWKAQWAAANRRSKWDLWMLSFSEADCTALPGMTGSVKRTTEN